MPAHLRISVRFLGGEFHGRSDGSEPEWPPSPLRLFQALTNAAARLDGSGIGAQNTAALRWLEALEQPPEILAAQTTPTTGYQLYVPDNVGDLVAKQWAAGKYFDSKNHPIDISVYRTERRVRPSRLSGDAVVHYFWPFDDANFGKHRETLMVIAHSVTHLGWGVDLVVADAAVEDSRDSASIPSDIANDRWLPAEGTSGTALRIPVAGTLDDLNDRHAAFLNRLQTTTGGNQFFRPVPPLATFRVVTYRRETDLARPPYAVFALRELDDSRYATFDPLWRRLHLAGMLRHTASQPDFAASLGWDDRRVNAFVLGHDKSDPEKSKPTQSTPRLLFIPLPSIEWRGEKRGHSVGAIRRVLVTVSGYCEASEFQCLVRALEGRELIDKEAQRPIAFLRRQSGNDQAVADYFAKQSAVWTTVTPVVLPGHDDPCRLRRRLRDAATPLTVAEKEQIIHKLEARSERLLRKAFLEAGLPAALVADAELQWRATGFVAGTDVASRYSVPDQCRRFRRLHVRVLWRERIDDGGWRPLPLAGPICIGTGRFSGLGLFVPVVE